MIAIEHIHPMIVHFPIVMLLIAAAADVALMVRGGDLAGTAFLSRVSMGALAIAAVSAVLAYLFGDMALDAALAKGFPEAALETHEGLGTTTMLIVVVLALLRLGAFWRKIALGGGRGWVLTLASLAGMGVMLLTAYHGGQLVYQLGVNVALAKP